jgi:hypothetical protein
VATIEDLLIKIGIDSKGAGKNADAFRKKIIGSMESVQDSARKALSGLTGLSTAGPVLAGVAGGAVSMGVALASAGVAAGVFGAVAKSAMSEVTEAASTVDTLQDKIDKYRGVAELAAKAGKKNEAALKGQAKATEELQAHLASLPPDVRGATESLLQLKSDWGDFVDQNKPAVYSLMTKGYKIMGQAMLKLQPLFDIGARAANRFVDAIGGAVEGGMIERMAERAGPALDSLTTIVLNFGTLFSRVFGKIGAEQGQGILDWLVDVTDRWVAWSEAPGENEGLNKLVTFLKDSGPQAVAALTSLATAAVAIAAAVLPLAPITAAVATGLADIIAALPPDVITALVTAMIAYGAALKAWAIYQAAATVVQWASNAAFLASPVTWIVIAILALIGVIVYLATKTQFFQTIWAAVWGFLKAVGAWFAGPFAGFFVMLGKKIAAFAVGAWNLIKAYFGFWYGMFIKVRDWGAAAVKWLVDKWNSFIGFIKSIPKKVSSALSNMWNGLKSGFRAAINWVIGKWNGLSFTIPSVTILGKTLGGGTLNTPNIPYLADGGVVPATPGGRLVVMGEGGEDEVAAPVSKLPDLAGDRRIVLEIHGDDSKAAAYAVQTLRTAVKVKGGDVQVVLGQKKRS